MDGYEERLDEWYKNMDKWLAELKKQRKHLKLNYIYIIHVVKIYI